MNPTPLPKFLETSPQGSDDFDSGSQNLIAESITKYIKEKQGNSHLIGVEGRWGSGKSNVIGIIKNKLGPLHHVYIYDAWAHQEDLKRRTFLEELTEDLIDTVLEKKPWEKKLKSLLAKEKETIQKTIPQLSYAVVVSFCAIILTPVSASIGKVIVNPAWSIIVASLPVIGAIVTWGIAAAMHKKYRNIQEFFYIYKTQELQSIKNETITETEPSIKQFRDWMTDVSKEICLPVVIVFDNMDRLPDDKIQTLWSSIHTFFSEKNYENIWVIVPYDRNQILSAFKDKTKTGETASDQSGYIEKTFSIIFHVPVPVLTDWQSFYKKKFETSFPQYGHKEYTVTRNIFDKHINTITPRKIIGFINELVALELIWQGRIEIKYMALYVLHREELLNDPTAYILKRGYLSRAGTLFKNDLTVEDKIAALTFNLPEADAGQLTLYREVQIRIREKQQGKFRELITHPKFIFILENIINTDEWEVEAMSISLNFLKESGLEEKHENSFKHIWQIIVNKQLGQPIEMQKFTDVFEILILKSEQYKLEGSLKKYITAQYRITREFNGGQYFTILNEMYTFCAKELHSFSVDELMNPVNLPSEQYLEYAEKAGNGISRFPVTCHFSILENGLIQRIKTDNIQLPDLKHLKEAYPFDKLKAQIELQITDSNVNNGNVLKLFKGLRDLSSGEIIAKSISDAHISTLLGMVAEGTLAYQELATMRIARIKEAISYGGVSDNLLSNANSNFASQIAERIEYYASYSTVIKNAQEFQFQYPLLKKIAKSITLDVARRSYCDMSIVIPYYSELLEMLEIPEQSFLSKLNTCVHLNEGNLDKEKIKTTIPNLSFYHIALANRMPLTEQIISSAAAYINELTKSAWDNVFENEDSYEFDLLYILMGNQIIGEIPFQANESFIAAVKSMTEDSFTNLKKLEHWHYFYEKCDQSKLTGYIQNVRDTFINNVNITNSQFLFLEPFFRKGGKLEERSSNVVRTIIMRIITNEASAEQIFKEDEFYANLIFQSEAEGGDVISYLRSKIEDGTGEISLKNFCIKLDSLLAPNVSLSKAIYYSDDEHVLDVTSIIKERIEVNKNLHFIISNELTRKDPDPGTLKTLKIELMGGTVKYFNENHWVQLP